MIKNVPWLLFLGAFFNLAGLCLNLVFTGLLLKDSREEIGLADCPIPGDLEKHARVHRRCVCWANCLLLLGTTGMLLSFVLMKK